MLRVAALFALVWSAGAEETIWPQFRGPNGSGVAENAKPPVEFSGQTNVLWKTGIPPGASSPCIAGDRIFLTAFEDGKLETLCIQRTGGKVLWRKTAPATRIESFHRQDGTPAASTPVTDGQRVYVYFGSSGVFCYDLEGNEQWRHELPTAETFGGFGTGTSPVLAEGLILLNRDQVGRSELLALKAATGKLVWTADRGQSYGWCTPAIWEHDGMVEVVLPASAVLKAYDLRTGAERWTVRGIAAATCSTPVVGAGLLFVSSWTPSEASNAPPPFASVLERSDQDGDGTLSLEESNGTDLRVMFHTFDLNRDQRITREEYDPLRSLATRSKNVLLAVRPGGSGDATDTHVAWSQNRGLPYVASPLYYQDRVYLVKDGGMASCFDARTGKPLYLQERLGPIGNYYASPVAADGRIYAASLNGVVTVFAAGDMLQVLARNDLGERISATPALADDTLYVRTAGHLYAFARSQETAGASSETAADHQISLFDGETLDGWRASEFTGSGKVQVQDGRILLESGYMTGITWTNHVPRLNYEISLEAMRVEGSDFFCGLTFPVGDSACTLVVGGWGGTVVGLSSLDYADAASNETTKLLPLINDRWYRVRVRVEAGNIQAWIDDKQVVKVTTTGRKVSTRPECEPSLPMGIATWSTTAALRNIHLREF